MLTMPHNRTTMQHGRSRRRVISCLPCRHRKLRCDRTLPACGNCVNRGHITACCYVARKPGSHSKPQESLDSSNPETAQDRIDRLEHLVLSLLKSHQHMPVQVDTLPGTDAKNGGNHGQSDLGHSDEEHYGNRSPYPERTTNLAKSTTSIKIGADFRQSVSVDEAHWALLLNEIGEVRSYLYAQHKRYEEQTKRMSQMLRQSSGDPGPTLLFGSARNVSRPEILSQLPSRYSCDIMVSRFFSHLYPAIHVLHGPTFQKQYERFWIDQSKTSIVWVGLLFAILRIAMLDYLREGDEPVEYEGKCLDLATSFRNRFTDCLIHADYLQPHDFLVESLILHLYGEYVSSRDARSSVWVLMGMIVRLAMRMGYHQPSQPTLTSTPFQAEMRRRAWAFIRQSDIYLSFQMGLPSMIRLRSFECSLPRNIRDDEGFDEDCTELPTALPDSEPTQISFLIAKTKLAFGFARAVKEISRADTVQWEKVLEIDRELRHIYDNVPDHYKLNQLSSQDSKVLISARFVLASIHHRSLCVVHSRFLEIAKSDYRYLYSRRVCLNSAMSILRFQAIQNQEIPVDGCLRSLTNYQTSLAIHDYLLAATIISAELCSNTFTDNFTSQPLSHGEPSRVEMIKALGISARIFGQMRDQSVEAYKAADVLGMLVRKIETGPHSATRSLKDLHQSHTSKSAWPKENSLPSHPISSHPQTWPQEHSTRPRLSQNFSRVPPRDSLSACADGPVLERPGTMEVRNSDVLSTWPETQENDFCAQGPVFSLGFPESDAPASWVLAENPESSAQSISERISDSTSSGAANSVSYYGASIFDDPVATLWDLNSDFPGDFNGT